MPGIRRRHGRFYQAVQQEAGGSQDDLSHEEYDDKDDDRDEDDDLDDKVSNVAPVAVAAEERTRRHHNVQRHLTSNVAIRQTPERRGR